MSGQRPIERVLDDWLAEGPDVIADRSGHDRGDSAHRDRQVQEDRIAQAFSPSGLVGVAPSRTSPMTERLRD